MTRERLETIEEKRRRETGGESERRECEEMRKFEGVFIGGNGNIGYKYHKCSKKNV